MAKKIQNNLLNELPLAAALEGEEKTWGGKEEGERKGKKKKKNKYKVVGVI